MYWFLPVVKSKTSARLHIPNLANYVVISITFNNQLFIKELKSARTALEEERKLRKVQTDTIRVSLDLYYHYFVRLGLKSSKGGVW